MILQRKYLLLCLLIFFFGCKEEVNYEPAGDSTPDNFVISAKKNLLRVKFASAPSADQQIMMYSASSPVTGFKGVDELTRKFGKIKRMQRLVPYSSKFDARHRAYGLDRWYKIEFEEDINTTKAVSDFSRLDEIEVVESDMEVTYEGGIRAIYASAPATRANVPGMPFNDPMLNLQWHYGKGAVETVEGADAGIYNAWRIEAGKPSVIVAVIDMGVDYKHEDMAANMWVNTKEIPGNGIDDDKNGYIDDIYGFNCILNNGFIIPGTHGTHIAGTIAAVNNNGIGVCGIAGGSGNGDGVRIMSCQTGDDWEGSGDFVTAFAYAADNGAVIASCSWGVVGVNEEPESLRDAVAYFIESAGDYEGSPLKGGVVIAAAGNGDTDRKSFPAASEGVVSVAATSTLRAKAAYSNYGDWITLSAPGGDVNLEESLGETFSILPNNSYGYMSGTSQATPHVSGIAALIISSKIGTGLTNDELKEILKESTVKLNDTEPEYADRMGVGLIKAELALCVRNEGAPDAITDLKATAAKRSVILSWTVPNDAVDKTPATYDIYISKAPITTENLANAEKRTISVYGTPAGEMLSETFEAGERNVPYYYAVICADMWGNASGVSNVVKYTNENPGTPETDGGVVLFPNPVKTKLTIGWEAWTTEAKEVFIYDLAGREVFHTSVGKSLVSGEAEIDLSTLASGKYILKFMDANNSIVRNILKVK